MQLTRFIALVTALAAFAAFGSDFQYQVPDGFRELPTQARPYSNTDESNVPPQLLALARDPRYSLVAIDPQSTTRDTIGATFNVVEMKSTGHMTLDLASKAANGIVAGFRSGGAKATLIDVNVVPMNGVDISVAAMDVDNGNGVVRMRQYVLPGRNGAAILTYSAPRADFESYYPSFLRSLRATKGVAEPPNAEVKWSWKEFFMSGLIGALIGVALYFVKKFLPRKGGEVDEPVAREEVPAKEPKRRPSKHLWYCDDCGNPVPIRLETCRCGGKKPAT